MSKVKILDGPYIGSKNIIKMVVRVSILTAFFVFLPVFVYVIAWNGPDANIMFKVLLPLLVIAVIVTFWFDSVDRIRAYQYQVTNSEPIFSTVENFPGSYEI